MTKNNLNELKATLESIREADHPEIPSEVISEIIDIQQEYQDNPTKRQSETRKIILKYANNIKSEVGATENEI